MFLQGKFASGNVIFPSALIQKRGWVRNVFRVGPVDDPTREACQNLPGVILYTEDSIPCLLRGRFSDLARVTVPKYTEAGFAQRCLLSYGFDFLYLCSLFSVSVLWGRFSNVTETFHFIPVLVDPRGA